MTDRCDWLTENELMLKYHDEEWGVPVRDGRELWEHLILDGFQAGLSWQTILNKREDFRKAFDKFVPEIIVNYGEEKIAELMADKGIVRNKLKITATIKNARAYLDMIESGEDFSEFIWSFTGGKTKENAFKSWKEIPAASPESERMSKALKAKGFSFAGSTICYAFMQAVGIVNDHTVNCFRHEELAGRSGKGSVK